MGFMDLSVGGSDQASDSAYVAVEAFAKQLEIEYKKDSNEWNTPGWLNVAMILTEMCDNYFFYSNERLQKLAKKCLVHLKKTPEYGCSTKKIRERIENFISKND